MESPSDDIIVDEGDEMILDNTTDDDEAELKYNEDEEGDDERDEEYDTRQEQE